MIQTLLD